MRPAILIPAYKPTQALVQLAQSITPHFSLIVVNDGSGAEFAPIFNALRSKNVTVLTHAVNLGKGEALKTGFNHFLNEYPDSPGIVTADADGQHLLRDIIGIAEQLEKNPKHLHLGSRAFDHNVPLRSQLGNITTRFVFKCLLGTKLQDTQTGLRGLPRFFLPCLLPVKSRGYDFELDMLVLAHKNKLPIQETTIETVYEDNNQSSHFNPLMDSLKIYYVFFRFLFFAIISGILDFLAFTLAFWFIPQVFFAESLARLFSGTCNFLFNKELVFRSKSPGRLEALKYTLLCSLNLVLSYGMISTLVFVGLSVHISKLIALISLFFANFVIQQLLIFSENETDPPLKTTT